MSKFRNLKLSKSIRRSHLGIKNMTIINTDVENSCAGVIIIMFCCRRRSCQVVVIVMMKLLVFLKNSRLTPALRVDNVSLIDQIRGGISVTSSGTLVRISNCVFIQRVRVAVSVQRSGEIDVRMDRNPCRD